VYQGYARGLDTALIRQLHQLACGGMTPHLTLLLDLAPEAGLARAWRRIDADSAHAKESRFETEALAFHQRVRDGYLLLARREPQRFAIIDAAGDRKAVWRQIESVLAARC
jgi:dTMP kinase